MRRNSHLFDVNTECVILQSTVERILPVKLHAIGHNITVLFLLARIVDPLRENKVVGYSVEEQQLAQRAGTEWREEVDDKLFGEFLPCIIAGRKQRHVGRSFKVTLFVLLITNVVVLQGVFETNLLGSRGLSNVYSVIRNSTKT